MGKEKAKGQKRITNKHLHARISYLHKAAVFLASQQNANHTSHGKGGLTTSCNDDELSKNFAVVDQECQDLSLPNHSASVPRRSEPPSSQDRNCVNFMQPDSGGLPARLVTHLRQVATKSIIRLDRSVKRSACKRCQAVMAESGQHTEYIDNQSRDGQKLHADVLVKQCTACGAKKRFPVRAMRQPRKSNRLATSRVQT